MERSQSIELTRKGTPHFSASAIGSPAAFSTAVKLPGSYGGGSESPFTNLEHRILQDPSPQHNRSSLTGRLSLSSTLSDKDPVPSLNNTSVGILDLDAMQDSSMHRFLTSPFDSQDLNLHMSSTMSVPSTQVSIGRTPVIGTINKTPPATNGLVAHNGVDVADQSLGLPQELLMRQEESECSSQSSSPSGSETADPFASHASCPSDDEGNTLAIAEAVKGGLDEFELTSSSLQSSYSAEEEEEKEPTDQPAPAAVNTSTQQNTATSEKPFSSHSAMIDSNNVSDHTVRTANASKEIALSLSPILHPNGTSGSNGNVNGRLLREGGETSSLILEDLSTRGGERELCVGRGDRDNGDETLIADEVEPSVMREAEEFSRFYPSQLTSLLDKDGLAVAGSRSLQSREIAEGTSAAAATMVRSKLGSSLPPFHSSPSSKAALTVVKSPNASVSKILTSTRMSTQLPSSGTKLHVSGTSLLPPPPSVPGSEDDGGGPSLAGRKEGSGHDGGEAHCGNVSVKTEGGLSFTSGGSSVLSDGHSLTHTMEGLPSAYLAPTSFLTDATDQSSLEANSAFTSLDQSPSLHVHVHAAATPHPPITTTTAMIQPPGVAGSVLSHTSFLSSSGSLPSSLTELAETLGSEQPLNPFTSGSSFDTPGGFAAAASAVYDDHSGGGAMSAQRSNGVYNPFDSDDNASIESFGQMEFGDQSSDSFLAQLAKDEEEIKAVQLTPSSEHLQSFASLLGATHFSTSLGDELSMDAYFHQKSGKMGQLSAVKLPPSERPRFSDTAGHAIESPLISDVSLLTTGSSHVTSIAPPTSSLESIPEGDPPIDTTLVSESADISRNRLLPHSATAAVVLAGPVRSLASSSNTASGDLTPVVTNHSPFPARFDMPKLDFSNTSALSHHLSPPADSHDAPKSNVLLSSSPLVKKSSSSDEKNSLAHRDSEVGLPPELLEPALTEDSSSSSLVFKEVSAISLTSPPSVLDPSLRSMPTPSIAKLPGFDVTEMTSQHFASFSSSRDVTASDLAVDQSLPLSSSHTMSKLENSLQLTSPVKLEAGVNSSGLKIQDNSHLVSMGNSLTATSARTSSSKTSRPSASELPPSAQHHGSKKISTEGHSPSELTSPKNPKSSVKKPSPSKVTFAPGSPCRAKTEQKPTTGHTPSPNLVKSPLDSTKMSPSKVSVAPRFSPSPIGQQVQQQMSPARSQLEQKLSTETLTTWSSGSPLTSPPQKISLHHDESLSVKVSRVNTTPSKATSVVAVTTESPVHHGGQGSSSPNTEAARRKFASLQVELDAACFNAEEFLANLKKNNRSSPAATSATTKTAEVTESKVLTVKAKDSSPTFTSSYSEQHYSQDPVVLLSTAKAKLSPTKSGRGVKGDDGKLPSTGQEMLKASKFVASAGKSSPMKTKSTVSVFSTPSSPQSKAIPSTSAHDGKKLKRKSSSSSSSIPRPTKPFMATPSTNSAAASKKKAKSDDTSSTEKRETVKRVVGERDKHSQPSEPPKFSSPKKVKYSHHQSNAGSARMQQRNIHIQDPHTSSTGRGGTLKTSSAAGTVASPTKFTLSSLLTSRAQAVLSPPSPKSSITVSSLSTSPSSHGHGSPTRLTAASPGHHNDTPQLPHAALSPTPSTVVKMSAVHTASITSPDTSIASISQPSTSTQVIPPSPSLLSTAPQHSLPTTSSLHEVPSSLPDSSTSSPALGSRVNVSHPFMPHLPASEGAAHHTSTPSHHHHVTAAYTKDVRTSHGLNPPPHPRPGNTIDSSMLQVEDSLVFDQTCCVGVSLSNQFSVSNLGERWLQLEFRLTHLYRDGAECSLSESVFSLPQRSFIGPEQQEPIKVIFAPVSAGSYEAIVAVHAHLVVSSALDSSSPLANVVLKGVAEDPMLEVQPSRPSSSTYGEQISGEKERVEPSSSSTLMLDYGVLVGGSSASLQLKLANRGAAYLPLCLSIAAKSALSQLYFRFGEVSQSLVSIGSPSSLVSSHLLHPHHHTLTLTLPPRPGNGRGNLGWYGINVHFQAPKRYIDDSIFDPGPPEEMSAELTISVNGLNPATAAQLTSIPLQAIVGVARLHVPRALQAVSLSCSAGHVVNRELPFRNAGNIPLRVRLKVSGNQAEVFNITPDFLLMEPKEESQVNIYFSPSSPMVCDGVLMIHIEPDGPNYELKLHGTATTTDTATTAAAAMATNRMGTEPVSTETEVEDGILSCNKRVLYWGGVKLHDSVCQEVLLHNSHSVAVPLSLSIRHSNSPFKLMSVDGQGSANQLLTRHQQPSERREELKPGRQLSVSVVYTPTSASVSLNALDITDLLHSKKYRIRLCGYGGSGHVEVVSGRKDVSGESWVDLGEIASGMKVSTKLSLFNSGPRAAFVAAVVYPDRESSSPLSTERVSVAPSKLVVPPHQIKDLQLIYHVNERDEATCSSHRRNPPSSPSPLACIKLTTGDEVLRQRLQKIFGQRLRTSLAGQSRERGENGVRPGLKLKNSSNEALLTHFPEQEAVPTDLDFSAFELEDEEGIFEKHLSTFAILLSGSSAKSKKKNTKTSSTAKKSPSMAFSFSPPHLPATARLKHKLSLSNTPPVRVSEAGHSSSSTAARQPTLSQDILASFTHLLPEAVVGRYSEKHLDIHNPYSADLKWELGTSASPFVRKSAKRSTGQSAAGVENAGSSGDSRGAGEIFKANYSVFWVSERNGITPPKSTSKVPILFQPQDPGSFSQIWDLKVSCAEIGTKKLRISFGGKAVAPPLTDHQWATQQTSHPVAPPPKSHDQNYESHDQNYRSRDRTEEITKWLSQTQRHVVTEPPPPLAAKATPPRKTVYIRDEVVAFPPTKVGSKSTVKVRVCNRGTDKYEFNVIKPVAPFTIDHHTFDLGSRQCARLPVHFSPVIPGDYTGVLAIRTNAGHQTFTELRAKSLS